MLKVKKIIDDMFYKTGINALLFKTGIRYSLGETTGEFFWIVLQLLLHEVKPKCLLEFGSGRSSYYLAEYAKYSGATFLSFEQSRSFMYRTMLGFRLALLPTTAHLRHLPVSGKHEGYREDVFYRIVQKDLRDGQKADFVFVDGPVGDEGRALHFFKPFESSFGDIKLAIVDDVHRPNSLEVAEWAKDRWGLNQCVFRYLRSAKLAILSTVPVEELLESSYKNFMADFLKSRSSE